MDQTAPHLPPPLLPVVSLLTYGLSVFFLGGAFGLYSTLLSRSSVLSGTVTYIVHTERKENARHGVQNVSGRGGLLFIICSGMSQQRERGGRRGTAALLETSSVTSLNF